MDDGDDEILARFGAATIFLVAAGLSLLVAYLGTSMDPGDSWGDPENVTWTIFSAASVVAAGLCGLPWGSWPMRFAGFLLLAPAILVMDAGHPGSGDSNVPMIAAGAAIVLLGGAVAGGIHRKLLGRSRA